MSTVYIEKVEAESLRLTNTSGGNLAQFQFVAMAGKSLVADEAILSTAIGGLTDVCGMVIQIADYVTGETTFGTANAAVYWDPATGSFSNTLTVGYYLIGYVAEIKSGTVTKVVCIDAKLIPADVADVAASVANIVELAGRPFHKTVTLTAAAAGTAVPIVAAGEVTGTNKIYISDILINVGGGTAWTDSTGTVVTIQDTAASPVVAVTAAKAQLTGNAILGKHSTGITLAAPIITGVGLTAAKGLDVIADSNFDAGSNMYVTVIGVIK
jgi:hypothetical protein